MQAYDLKPNYYALTACVLNRHMTTTESIGRFLDGQFKPSEQTILRMKRLYRNGMQVVEIADLHGIHPSVASRVIHESGYQRKGRVAKA